MSMQWLSRTTKRFLAVSWHPYWFSATKLEQCWFWCRSLTHPNNPLDLTLNYKNLPEFDFSPTNIMASQPTAPDISHPQKYGLFLGFINPWLIRPAITPLFLRVVRGDPVDQPWHAMTRVFFHKDLRGAQCIPPAKSMALPWALASWGWNFIKMGFTYTQYDKIFSADWTEIRNDVG